ncbi:MAG: glutamate formimidoyltransferase [Acidimicrobiia bacterium]
MLEAVVNVSEGRDRHRIDAIGAAAGPALVDVHADPDHHRSVFTIAASESAVTEAATRRLTSVAFEDLDLAEHAGVHPRLGVVDVVPFVALAPTPADVAVACAHAFGAWLVRTHHVPVFFYGDAAPDHRSLPEVRRDAFGPLAPDLGASAPHPRYGATAVGARPPLIAVNVELATDDLELARRIARETRERDGGLLGVRALGLRLDSRRTVQVSMNLVDLGATGLERACNEVRERAHLRDVDVARVELVGLIPRAELDRCSAGFRAWAGITERDTVEARRRA